MPFYKPFSLSWTEFALSMYSSYGPRSTAVQQPAGLSYNAQTGQWVPSAAPNASGVVQYAQQTPGASSFGHNQSPLNNHAAQNNKRVPPPAPVTTFTKYYHAWKALAEGKRPRPPELSVEWANYYADLSSRAAHFFHSNPNALMADFDLPPAPPPEPSHSVPPPPPPTQQPVGNYVPSSYLQQPSQQQPQQYANNIISQPLTYQQYMEKCLQGCHTVTERTEMQQRLQQVIQQAVTDGTLNRDWSTEPLLTPRGDPRLATTSYYGSKATSGGSTGTPSQPEGKKKKKRRWDNPASSSTAANEVSYYGPSETTGDNKAGPKRSQPFATTLHGYYGPSTITNTSTSSKNKKWKQSDKGFDKSVSALSERAKRFASSWGNASSSFSEENEMATQGPIIVGTCQTLEKDYLRLTSAPRPELVRPKPILEKHLANLVSERQDVEHRRDYLWFCSQLKALRQDLTVQHIRDPFTVQVYETHARIALEEGDLNEFNQCQTQLRYLYEHISSEDNIGTKEAAQALAHQDEFVAYRLLYSILLTQNEKYQGGSSDLLKILQSLTATQRRQANIAFANAVRTWVAEGNYHSFFAALKNSSKGGSHAGYLLHRLVPAMRSKALPRIIRACRPVTVPVDFVLQELALDDDIEYGRKWLESCGCVLSDSGKVILCKESEFRESNLEEKNSLN